MAQDICGMKVSALKRSLHELPLTSTLRDSPLAVAGEHLQAFEALRLGDCSVKQDFKS
jgi:hypothetical protein